MKFRFETKNFHYSVKRYVFEAVSTPQTGVNGTYVFLRPLNGPKPNTVTINLRSSKNECDDQRTLFIPENVIV